MESDLRVAVEKGLLWVAFQPSVDASNEAVTGFEALVRWDHPEHGSISPTLFIPLAEEIGLIPEIAVTDRKATTIWSRKARISLGV